MAKILIPFFITGFVFINSSIKGQSATSLPECNCAVLVTGEFTKYVDTFATDIGTLYYHTYSYSDTGITYQLSYIDYPEGTVHSDSTELLVDLFSSTIDAAVESVKGDKKYETEIHQFGYPGWFWKIDFGGDKFIKSKAFVAGKRFYTLQIIGSKKYDDDKRNTPFFDSFKFIDLRKIK